MSIRKNHLCVPVGPLAVAEEAPRVESIRPFKKFRLRPENEALGQERPSNIGD